MYIFNKWNNALLCTPLQRIYWFKQFYFSSLSLQFTFFKLLFFFFYYYYFRTDWKVFTETGLDTLNAVLIQQDKASSARNLWCKTKTKSEGEKKSIAPSLHLDRNWSTRESVTYTSFKVYPQGVLSALRTKSLAKLKAGTMFEHHSTSSQC